MAFVDCLSYHYCMSLFKIKTAFDSQPLWQQFLIVLIFNTFIAIAIHSVVSRSIFSNQIILSQSIGISIFLSFVIFANILELKRWKLLIPLVIGSFCGVVIVIAIQALMVDASFEMILDEIKLNYTSIISVLFVAIFFGLIVTLFFVGREQIFRTKTKLQALRIDNLDQQKTIAETSLRLLQAQIEPHFLFNTLSNIISLIDKEPQKSKKMLESLTDFLRSSLKRSTDIHQNLREEISLIKNYLDIMKIRIGKRLEYNIHIQDIHIHDDIIDCAFPPLLLQPLVENAIIHGIEPLTEGGVIDIDIAKDNDKLSITVSDTGIGLTSDNIKGFGLSNIRDRIRRVYSGRGRLMIEENKPRGVIATIEIPYEAI